MDRRIFLLAAMMAVLVSGCGLNFHKNRLRKAYDNIEETLAKYPELADTIQQVEYRELKTDTITVEIPVPTDTAEFNSLLAEYYDARKLIDSLENLPVPDTVRMFTDPERIIVDPNHALTRQYIDARRRVDDLRAQLQLGAYVDTMITVVDTLSMEYGDDVYTAPYRFTLSFIDGILDFHFDPIELEIESNRTIIALDTRKRLFPWKWIIVAIVILFGFLYVRKRLNGIR